jgi:hypothetical protein
MQAEGPAEFGTPGPGRPVSGGDQRRPVDVTLPVLVAAGLLLAAVGAAYWLGAIPRPLAAAATAATALVVVLLGVSIVELIDSRLEVGWTADHLPEWWSHPTVPIAALGIGLVIGYFFW